MIVYKVKQSLFSWIFFWLWHNEFMNIQKPLAERMRPRSLDQYVGQGHLVGDGKILQRLISQDKIPSMILWGPPGTGKTTLARIIAKETESHFVQLSAINSGVKDIRQAVENAESFARLGTKTILFIDEVHRFNKAQQDAFLPSVEDGTITFIGATNENPSFEVNNALLSRSRTFVLEQLSSEEILGILHSALLDNENGLGDGRDGMEISLGDEVGVYLSQMSGGDARTALNALEVAAQIAEEADGVIAVSKEDVDQALQKSLLYDRDGEEHYNIISAFHKSMRGGDADATLYWMTRMLAGGEDPLYIARRIVRFASEDIGLANSFALPQATAAYDACRFIGMPECGVNLAQAAVYMAKSKKSIAVYEAYNASLSDAHELGNLPVPLHLRNAPTKLMKDLDYGKGYKYTPKSSEEENASQEFMPEKLVGKKYLNFE